MKKIILSMFLFHNIIQSKGQSVSADTKIQDPNKRVHFGIYFMPTITKNIGQKTPPGFFTSIDCMCYVGFSDIKESPDYGYNLGFEVESMKFMKRLSASAGSSVEYYHYTGTATETTSYIQNIPPKPSKSYSINYYYKNYFLDVSLALHYYLINNKLNHLNIYLAASGAKFIQEDNKGYGYYTKEYGSGEKKLATFTIAGIDYFLGNKHLLNLGIRITSQNDKTPKGRKLQSAGIKIGFFY